MFSRNLTLKRQDYHPKKGVSILEPTMRSLQKQLMSTVRLGYENEKGVKKLGLNALVDNPTTSR